MIIKMVRISNILGLAATATLGSCNCIAANATSPDCRSPEVPSYRETFFIGGHTLEGNTTNTTIDQLYVEKLTPVGVISKQPMVFFHGGGVSSATFLNTPDNRRGWASYFLDKGHEVYLLDIASVGRSSESNYANFTSMGTSSHSTVQEFFTAPELYDDYPQGKLHTQFPGEGVVGDPIFDQFMASFLPLSYDLANTEYVMRKSGCEVLRRIDTPVYTVCHSLGCRQPLLMSNDCPDYFLGNINIEAAMSPFWSYNTGLGGSSTSAWGLTNTPVDYEPAVNSSDELTTVSVGNETLAHRNCILQTEPAYQLPKINSVPFMMITSEASVHATYDHCLIEYLNQTGGSPEWIKLADRNINGNGHFMYLENNNLDIAAIVEDWMDTQDDERNGGGDEDNCSWWWCWLLGHH